MPYLTVIAPSKTKEITLDDILNGFNPRGYIVKNVTNNTVTRLIQTVPTKLHSQVDYEGIYNSLCAFNTKYKKLKEVDRQSLYNTFYIPKKSGGLRKIDAPNNALKDALYELKDILETKFHCLHHTSAFAYVKNRSTIDALRKHQQNSSRWYAKFDFSNFFGSTTPEFTISMLEKIFPFSEIMNAPSGEELKKALELCFLNGGLPQGTPISPFLTNIIMIPIDAMLSKSFRDYTFADGKIENLIYTRYADDILLSCRYDFNYRDVESYINKVLKDFNAPFKIKEEKTRYGSNSGRNWNLGLMINSDNKITIGHKRKKEFKNMINNYMNDKREGRMWNVDDLQVLQGLTSYYLMVEKEYICHLISTYESKYNRPFTDSIKADIKAQQ